jgi:hypothetical protein
MTELFQFIGSGAVFYVLLGALSVVAFYVVWNLPHVVRMVFAPLGWVMAWVGRGPVGRYVKQTKVWLWLEKQELDPPAHPLSWWATRGLLVLALWACSLALTLHQGREWGREEGPQVAKVSKAKSAYRKPVSKDWWE